MEKNDTNQNRYLATLAKYNTQLDDAKVQAQVLALIEKKVPENNNEEVKKFLFNCIDLTTLNSTDSDEIVMHFTEKVNLFDTEYPDLKNVAAICVYPNFAEVVKDTLEVDGVKIACVSAGFPSSQTFIEVKIAETAMAIMEGADEIDIVISIGKFLSGDYETMCEEIQELKDVCKENHLKVILETGELKSASNIKKAYYPIDVCRSRLHQDIDRKTTACCYRRGCLCDVSSDQRVPRTHRPQNWFQTCRRHQHSKRCVGLLHHRERGIGQGVAYE